MTDTIIRVQNLFASYNEVDVLRGVSLEVRANEIMVIMGQSGCGKTTFMRHLVGLQKPKAGLVEIEGQDPGRMNDEQYRRFCRSVGVLFQSGALFNSMTVSDNVAFPLREHTRLAAPVIDIIVKMKLDQVGLSGTEHQMPSELSGGMKKRAGLARALAMDPTILFLDEPTTGLDPIIAAGIDELILRLREAYGATMVVVSHDIQSGMGIADRIALFHEGKLEELGTPEQVRSSSNPFVRRFLERRPDSDDRGPSFLARSRPQAPER